MRIRKRSLVVCGIGFLLFGLFLAVGTSTSKTPWGRRVQTLVTPRLDDRTTLGSPPPEVAKRIVPDDLPRPVPTNRWWSGGILERWPAPLFAWPWVTRFTNGRVVLATPTRTVAGRSIVATARDEFALLPVEGTLSRAAPQAWGDWDVTFRVRTAKRRQWFDLTAVQGSPYVFVQLEDLPLALELPPESRVEFRNCQAPCGALVVIRTPQTTYALVASATDMLERTGPHRFVIRPRGEHPLLTLVAVAEGSRLEAYLPFALSPPTPTRTAFEVGDTTISTTFTYGSRTAFGVFPHQQLRRADALSPLGEYETLRGVVRVYEGDRFTTVVPRPVVLPSLPLSESLRQDSSFRAGVVRELREPPAAADVYNAGKHLLRTAHLAEITTSMGDDDRSKGVAALREELADWCTAGAGESGKQWTYDNTLGGLIGMPPAFGSERYNDHHFHAGYFIHAAAILARLDSAFVKQYGDCLDLIIRDVASDKRNDPQFPWLRNFDPYAGHSWANGFDRLEDGNNQESTSEAMQAWYAIALWGKTIGDRRLHDLGLWLLSQEISGARAYWLNSDPETRVFPPGFPYPMISILWGGKVDYATFFDGNPAAIHGIQFFPATPALFSLVDHDVLKRLIEPLLGTPSSSPWALHVKLVAALGRPAAREQLPADVSLDPVYSRSYITRWLNSSTELGALVSPVTTHSVCGVLFTKDQKRTAAIYRFRNDPTSCSLTNPSTGRTHNFSNLDEGWNIRSLEERD